jgi:hypothetical protein
LSEYTDWEGVGRTAGLAVLLPGRNYPTTMPLLTFAGRVAVQHGWQVRAVSWRAPDLGTEDMITWVGDQVHDAVDGYEGPVTVIGKSLGTCAAAVAADRGYDAIWLTPLLHLPEVVEAMVRHPGRQLLIGGTEDPAWNLQVANSITDAVVQLDGADHGVFTHDAIRSAELHVEVTRAMNEWIRAARTT